MSEKSLILIVDDQEEVRETMKGLLIEQDCSMEFASNGNEAIVKATKFQPDLILLDVMMDEMDGYEVCLNLRAQSETEDIPIIMVTILDDHDSRINAYKVGADDIISKPFNSYELKAKVRNIVTLNRYRKLHQEKEKFTNIIEVLPDSVIIINKQNKILHVNSTFLNWLGIDNNRKIIGKQLKEFLFINNLPEKNNNLFWQNIFNIKTFSGEFNAELRCQNAKTVFVDIVTCPINWFDKKAALLVLRNITKIKKIKAEKKEIEKRFYHTQKMEAISNLAGSIFHDFANLIGIIQGNTELLLYKKDKDDPLYEMLLKILNASQRANVLSRKLLSLTSKKSSENKVFCLNDVISDMTKLFQTFLNETIELKIELQPYLWLIKANVIDLEQVIMNLTLNAQDAMSEGGILSVKTKNVEIDQEYCSHIIDASPGSYVCLDFSDSGKGIDSATQQRIFEPFFTTKSEKGTGLGLATVYGIVKQLDGWVVVNSEIGKGTTFSIFIPKTYEEAAKQEKVDLEITSLKGRSQRILIVEDDKSMLDFDENVLSTNGYNVFTARNMEQAKSIYRQENGKFELVFCDLVLPSLEKQHIVDWILNNSPEMKILLTSGYPVESRIRPNFKKNFSFLPKPYTIKSLLKAVYQELISD